MGDGRNRLHAISFGFCNSLRDNDRVWPPPHFRSVSRGRCARGAKNFVRKMVQDTAIWRKMVQGREARDLNHREGVMEKVADLLSLQTLKV